MFRRATKFTVRSVKSTFNVFAWVGSKQIKDSTSSITKLSQPIFAKQKYDNKGETFSEAAQRFHLSDKDLAEKEHGLTREIYMYLGLAGVLALYFFYLLFRLDLLVALIMLGIIALLACKFYQAHYRRYCIRSRSLDKTFKDWWKNFVGSKSS